MHHLSKIIYTETGHRLTNYIGRCAHLHGHSYKWEVTVSGENNDNGMVMDFKDLKKILNETIDTLDHSFVMHFKDPICQAMDEDEITALFQATDGSVPRLHLVPFNPTVENLVKWQWDKIYRLLPFYVTLTRIKCWETASSFCEKTN